MRVSLEVMGEASNELRNIVEIGLADHAASANVPPRHVRALSVVARGDGASVMGAFLGRTVWGWLHVSELWVAERYRRKGIGRSLMTAAERVAVERGCYASYLDTFDFQAVSFYELLGYSRMGALEGFPFGHTRFFLQKRLTPQLVAIAVFPQSLETKRLRLRRAAPTDAEEIFQAYAQDAEVTRFLVWRPHKSVDTVRQFLNECNIRWEKGQAYPYVITLKEEAELIGMIEIRPNGHRADFGFGLARAHWGKGLMPEAISAVITLGLSQPMIYRMEATCDIENKASARALEKAGLLREGVLRKYIIHPNISAEPRDSLLYAITK
jgi:[ribosomal protein S5]-alanine N-acetyltransferase